MAVDSVARAIAVKNGSGGGGGGGGTSNYNDLNNKPSINGVTLSGNKTTEDLGLLDENNYEDAINKPSINNITLEGDKSASDLGLMTFLNIPHDEEIPEDNGLYAKLKSTDSDIDARVASNMEEYVLVNEGEISRLFTVPENPSNGDLVITNYKLIKNVSITKPGGAYAYIKFNTSLSDEQVTEILDSLDGYICFYMNQEGSDYKIQIESSSIALYGDEGSQIATIYTTGEGWSEDAELMLARSGFMGCCFIVDPYSYTEDLEKITDLVSADYYAKINQPINGLFEEKYEYGGYTHTRLVSNKNVKTKFVFAESLDYVDTTISPNTYSSFYINSLMSKEEVVTVLTKTFNHRFYTDGVVDFTVDVIQNDDEYAGVSRVIQIHFSVLGGFSIINHDISGETSDYTIFDETHGWATNLSAYEGPLSGFQGSDLYPHYGLFKFNENYQWSSCIFLIFSSKLFTPICSLESVDENQILTASNDINQEGNYNLKVDGVVAQYQEYELVDKLYLNNSLSGADAVECFEAFYYPFDYQNHTLELIKCQGATVVLYVNNRNNMYYQLYIRYNDNTSKTIFYRNTWYDDGVEAFNNLVGPFRTLSSSIQNYSGTPILLGKTIYTKSWAPASGGGDIPANIECETATLTESGSDKTLYLTKDVVALLDENASAPKSTQMAAGTVILCNDDGSNPTHITTINDTQISVTDTTVNSTAASLNSSRLNIVNITQNLSTDVTNAGVVTKGTSTASGVVNKKSILSKDYLSMTDDDDDIHTSVKQDGIYIEDNVGNVSNIIKKNDSTMTNGSLSSHIKCDRIKFDSSSTNDVSEFSAGHLLISSDTDDCAEISATEGTFTDSDNYYQTIISAIGIDVKDAQNDTYEVTLDYNVLNFRQTDNDTDYHTTYGMTGFLSQIPGNYNKAIEATPTNGFKATGTFSSKACVGQLTSQKLTITNGTGASMKKVVVGPNETYPVVLDDSTSGKTCNVSYDSIGFITSGNNIFYNSFFSSGGFDITDGINDKWLSYNTQEGLRGTKALITTASFDPQNNITAYPAADRNKVASRMYVGQTIMIRYYMSNSVDKESAALGIVVRKSNTELGGSTVVIATNITMLDASGSEVQVNRIALWYDDNDTEVVFYGFDMSDEFRLNESGARTTNCVDFINIC